MQCPRCKAYTFLTDEDICWNCVDFLRKYPYLGACHNCGALAPWHGGACPSCGGPVAYVNTPEADRCAHTNCGSARQPGSIWCAPHAQAV